MFLEKKQVAIFLSIAEQPSSILELARRTSVSYVFAWKIIKKFHALGLIEISRRGKRRCLMLTEKGHELKSHIMAIKELIGDEVR
jgi:predicted transcriptional regulator